MMEKFPKAKFTFQHIQFAYHREMDLLSSIAESALFPHLLEMFSDLNRYLYTPLPTKQVYDRINRASGGSRIIADILSCEPIREAVYASHLAACCSILTRSSFFPDQLTAHKLRTLVDNMLNAHTRSGLEVLTQMSYIFHVGDTIRTMIMLRCLGLITRKTEEIDILGLGVASGYNEVWALHARPEIRRISPLDPPPDRIGQDTLIFNLVSQVINSAVVVDADPQQKEAFEQLESLEKPAVHCINDTIDIALERLPGVLAEKGMSPRNLISIIRFDHRMIPDVARLLRDIKPVMCDEADLIVSVGSGQTIDEFRGRVGKIKEFYDQLEKYGLQPVLFKQHGMGALEKQWENPVYGWHGITTYELLYCHLRKNAISD